MDSRAVERAASFIRAARVARRPLGALPADCRPADETDAYRVQEALNAQLTAGGAGPLAGHKIGCTTPVMQAYLKIPNPCAGEVFARSVQRGHGRFMAADLLRPGVECEIAVGARGRPRRAAGARGSGVGRGRGGHGVDRGRRRSLPRLPDPRDADPHRRRLLQCRRGAGPTRPRLAAARSGERSAAAC